MNPTRKVIVILFLCFLVAGTIGRVFFPLQLLHFLSGVELWRNGVHEFHAGPMSGLLRDNCDPQDPEARGCTCVALIHGLGDSPYTWKKELIAPKSVWKKPVKLYALDLPKNQQFKEGDAKEPYRVRNQVTEIENALAPVCPSWVVIGNSLGGWEAAWIALDSQAGKLKVEKLILIDSVGTKSSANAGGMDFFTHPTPENTQELLARLYFKPPVLSERERKFAAQMNVDAHTGAILEAQTGDDVLDGRLTSLRIPTMVLWGAADRLVPVNVGKEIQAQIPGSIWREIPECGHIPQKECPVPTIQAINDMLGVGTM